VGGGRGVVCLLKKPRRDRLRKNRGGKFFLGRFEAIRGVCRRGKRCRVVGGGWIGGGRGLVEAKDHGVDLVVGIEEMEGLGQRCGGMIWRGRDIGGIGGGDDSRRRRRSREFVMGSDDGREATIAR